MSYFADITCITTPSGQQRLARACRQAERKAGMTCHLLDLATIRPSRNPAYVVMEWRNVRWYELDPTIQAFMNTLLSLRTPYQFVRIGEDIEDNEYLVSYGVGFDEDYDMPSLHLKREIEIKE